MRSIDVATETVVQRPGDYWRHPDIAESYDSGRFDNLRGRVYRGREERAIELALRGLRPGSSVLDAACGTGRITALLLRNGFQASGCDISPAMMTVARRRVASLGCDVRFTESSVDRLPYPDQSFDAATCVGLLMHLDAEMRVQALRELARVTRGRLVVQYVCVDVFQRWSARITHRPPGQVRFPVPASEMRQDLDRSGLRMVARFWALRGLSSSLIVVLSKSGDA